MPDLILKLVSSVGASMGALLILLSIVFLSQGRPPDVSLGMLTLKIALTSLRVALLFLCAWAAWRSPNLTPWFAWGSFAVFSIAGLVNDNSTNEVFHNPGNMIPAYYFGASLHVIFAIAVSLLSRAASRVVS